MIKYWESHDQVPRVSEKVAPWLRQTGSFSEVNVHEVILPFGNPSSATTAGEAQTSESQGVDAKVGALAKVMTESSRRGFSVKKHNSGIPLGSTSDLKTQCVGQFSTLEWQMDMPLHFVYARKSV
jgi:hypothetical protein